MEQVNGTQSIDRVFDIIERIAAAPKGLKLSEITQQTGLNKSTVHRQLAALTQRGYVVQDTTSKAYRLSLRLFEIAGSALASLDILEVAKRPLEELRNKTQEAVHLVVREQNEIVYIQKWESLNQGIHMFSRVGMRRPMYCTAVGKAILATLPLAQVHDIWKQSNIQPYTPYTIVSLDSLYHELEKIRVRGYAEDNEENEIGVRCIATTIPDYSGHSYSAFSVSAPALRMTDQKMFTLAGQLLETSHKIGIELGYRNQ